MFWVYSMCRAICLNEYYFEKWFLAFWLPRHITFQMPNEKGLHFLGTESKLPMSSKHFQIQENNALYHRHTHMRTKTNIYFTIIIEQKHSDVLLLLSFHLKGQNLLSVQCMFWSKENDRQKWIDYHNRKFSVFIELIFNFNIK